MSEFRWGPWKVRRVKLDPSEALRAKSAALRPLRRIADFQTRVKVDGKRLRPRASASTNRVYFYQGDGVQIREKGGANASRLRYNIANYGNDRVTVKLKVRALKAPR